MPQFVREIANPSLRAAHPLSGAGMTSALAAVFLGAVDLTVISTVLPRIVAELQINTADIDRYIWVVNGYLLAYIIAIPLVGRLSDIIGRRFAMEVALILFLAGSIWSGFAQNLSELIAARALQGAGGGALLPIAMAITGDLFSARKRLTALGVVGTVDTLGWVLGPLWGAAILELAGTSANNWRWVFWINIPIGLALLATIHRGLPPRSPSLSGSPPVRLDLLGAFLLGAGLLLVNLALSSGGEAGSTDISTFRAFGGTHNPLAAIWYWLFLAGIVILGLFAYWQRHYRSPLFPSGLFRDRSFLLAQLTNFAFGAALVAAMVNVPLTAALLVAEDRVSLVSALLLAPFTLVMAAAAFFGGVWATRRGIRAVSAIGFGCITAGYFAVWVGLEQGHYLGMIPGLAGAGFGFGVVIAPVSARAIDHSLPENRGIAAASTVMFRLLGMTTGLSVLTAYGIHRLQVRAAHLPSIVRGPDESTADFFLRQNQFIQEVAIPMAIGVIRETFLLAGLFAFLALAPVILKDRASRYTEENVT